MTNFADPVGGRCSAGERRRGAANQRNADHGMQNVHAGIRSQTLSTRYRSAHLERVVEKPPWSYP